MKGLILLADYFEDTEALTTVDVLFRAGEKITKAAVKNTLEVFTQCGGKVICDELLININYQDYDYLIVPGGKASFTILNQDSLVEEIIDYFVNNNKLVASICAAPHLLGRKGYFANREFTCFPGFEQYCINGIYRRDLGVVRDDKFVSAKAMYYSIDFALNILSFLYKDKDIESLRLSLMGEK